MMMTLLWGDMWPSSPKGAALRVQGSGRMGLNPGSAGQGAERGLPACEGSVPSDQPSSRRAARRRAGLTACQESYNYLREDK